MKKIYILASLFFLSAVCQAQVYRFTPAYSYESRYYREYKELTVVDYQECLDSIIFDLDNNTILHYGPGIKTEAQQIKSVKRDKSGYMINLVLKPFPGYELAAGYLLYTDIMAQPVYCSKYISYTGSAGDTTFTNYIDELRLIAFKMVGYKILKDTAVNGDISRLKKKLEYEFITNKLSLENGTLIWEEGKGKNAIKHTFYIHSVNSEVGDESMYKGFTMIMANKEDFDREDFSVYYILNHRTSNQYPNPKSITISKFGPNPTDENNPMMLEFYKIE